MSENVLTKNNFLNAELEFGFGPEDVVLTLDEGSQRSAVQPWLLDIVGVKISRLGHQDILPKSWDWENFLTLLKAEEELLYVLDHRIKDEQGSFDLWLAIRFPENIEIKKTELSRRKKRAKLLLSQFYRQAFPGSETQWLSPNELTTLLSSQIGSDEHCVAVTGMPSTRTLKDNEQYVDREKSSRNYQSLNDVVEGLYDLNCNYRLVFAVKRISRKDMQIALSKKTTFYDQIHPYVQATKREGSNKTEGINWNSSESKGGNKSTSIGLHLGTVFGGMVFSGISGNHTRGTNWTRTESEGGNQTKGESSDTTREYVNSFLRLADTSLKRSIDSLHEAYGTAGFRWGTFAFAEEENVEMVAQSLISVLLGSRTKDQPLTRFKVDGEQGRLLSSRTSITDLIQQAAPILPLARACEALLLPEAELPGLRLHRNVFFGRNVSENKLISNLLGQLALPERLSDQIILGPDSFSAIGNKNPVNIVLPLQDLFRHVLISGTTGSGKTVRVVEILNNIPTQSLSIIVFETAKRTYRTKLQRFQESDSLNPPIVYELGSSKSYGKKSRFRPLRINPFFFDKGTSLKRHIAILSDALTELMPTEAMIGPLMRRAVEACYQERKWDIENGSSLERVATWPTVIDFVMQVRKLISQLNYGPEVNANYRGALESRASLFLDATFQDIFGYDGNGEIEEIFPFERDAIIEVELLPPTDVDIRAFVMTLLITRLRAVQAMQITEQKSPQRQWLLVMEEAHNVLDRQFEERRPADESNAGRTLLRSTVRLLQEGRELKIGVMVVDQSPTRLARDVIANTGTKITLRLEDAQEMKEIGQAIGLEKEAWQKFGYLQVGEALVKASYMDRPAKSAPFQTLSDGPKEKTPGKGIPTSFVKLAACWKPVLKGTIIPDQNWLKTLLKEANQNKHLALFVGLREHIFAELGQENTTDLAELRHLLALPKFENKKLIKITHSHWSGIVQKSFSKQIKYAAAILCNAWAPSSVWPTGKLSSDGLIFISNLLAKVGFCEEEELFWIFSQAEGRYKKNALELLAEHMKSFQKDDPTAIIRILLSTIENTLVSFSDEFVSPLQIVYFVQEFVQEKLPLGESTDQAEEDAVNKLLEKLENTLILQMAGQLSLKYARKTELFLTRMRRLT